LAWLSQFRRLIVRYERRLDIHKAFLHLGCALNLLESFQVRVLIDALRVILLLKATPPHHAPCRLACACYLRVSNHLPCPSEGVSTHGPAPSSDNTLFYGDNLPHGAEVKMPPQFGTFKQAQRVKKEQGAQLAFEVK
jgi:hypothetical protein